MRFFWYSRRIMLRIWLHETWNHLASITLKDLTLSWVLNPTSCHLVYIAAILHSNSHDLNSFQFPLAINIIYFNMGHLLVPHIYVLESSSLLPVILEFAPQPFCIPFTLFWRKLPVLSSLWIRRFTSSLSSSYYFLDGCFLLFSRFHRLRSRF